MSVPVVARPRFEPAQGPELEFPRRARKSLQCVPIQTYWTTNYDRLIEKALEAGGRRVDSKYTVNQLATTRRGRDAVVYKMHGDIEHPSEAILSKDDYERYSLSHGPFITALSSDLIQKTFLFLGFSFTDPNLDFVLSRIPAHPQLRVYDVVWLSSDSGGHSLFGIRFSERKLNSLVHEHHHAED